MAPWSVQLCTMLRGRPNGSARRVPARGRCVAARHTAAAGRVRQGVGRDQAAPGPAARAAALATATERVRLLASSPRTPADCQGVLVVCSLVPRDMRCGQRRGSAKHRRNLAAGRAEERSGGAQAGRGARQARRGSRSPRRSPQSRTASQWARASQREGDGGGGARARARTPDCPPARRASDRPAGSPGARRPASTTARGRSRSPAGRGRPRRSASRDSPGRRHSPSRGAASRGVTAHRLASPDRRRPDSPGRRRGGPRAGSPQHRTAARRRSSSPGRRRAEAAPRSPRRERRSGARAGGRRSHSPEPRCQQGARLDPAAQIPGWEAMSAAQRMRARTKLLLERGAAQARPALSVPWPCQGLGLCMMPRGGGMHACSLASLAAVLKVLPQLAKATR